MMTDDPRLAVLGQFTAEKALTPGYGDTYLFLVGRDNVHGVLAYLLGHESLALRLSMYDLTDTALNTALLALLNNPAIHVQITLDRSEATSPTNAKEKALLAADVAAEPAALWANSVKVISSPTGQIAHTKGGVCSSLGMAFEGSVNWTVSGEGVRLSQAQDNTLVVTTNPVFLSRFAARLDVEHNTGKRIALDESSD